MKLSQLVNKFSTELFYAVEDLSHSIKGHLSPYAEITNSGVSSSRRILETPVSEVPPLSRTVITPDGGSIFLSLAHKDYWMGNLVRLKYSTIPVTFEGHSGTIGAVLDEDLSVSKLYCYPYFVRRELDTEERSDYLSGFEIYFPPNISLDRGTIITAGRTYYLLKTDTWLDGVGFSVSQAIKLENPVQEIEIVTENENNFDPITETYTNNLPVNVKAFVMDMTDEYMFIHPSRIKPEIGDIAVSTVNTVYTLNVGDKLLDKTVLSVKDFGLYSTAHCR